MGIRGLPFRVSCAANTFVYHGLVPTAGAVQAAAPSPSARHGPSQCAIQKRVKLALRLLGPFAPVSDSGAKTTDRRRRDAGRISGLALREGSLVSRRSQGNGKALGRSLLRPDPNWVPAMSGIAAGVRAYSCATARAAPQQEHTVELVACRTSHQFEASDGPHRTGFSRRRSVPRRAGIPAHGAYPWRFLPCLIRARSVLWAKPKKISPLGSRISWKWSYAIRSEHVFPA